MRPPDTTYGLVESIPHILVLLLSKYLIDPVQKEIHFLQKSKSKLERVYTNFGDVLQLSTKSLIDAFGLQSDRIITASGLPGPCSSVDYL